MWLAVQQYASKAQNSKNDTLQEDSEKVVSHSIIKGIVLDSLNDGHPVPFALIEVTLQDSTIMRSYTNTLGQFNILIDKEQKESDTMSISCIMLGYDKIKSTSTVRDTIDVEFFLLENHVCLKEIVIAVDPKNNKFIRGGMVGDVTQGIPLDRRGRTQVYHKHRHNFPGTKTYYSD
jgi:hypothetical protein